MLESWFDGSAEKQAGTIERSNDAQAKVDSATEKLALITMRPVGFAAPCAQP